MNPVQPRFGAVRIATVYSDSHFRAFRACDMSLIRWLRMSEALARKGYQVDMIVNLETELVFDLPNLRCVSYTEVSWDRYDVIKTLFHLGFQSLMRGGGIDHPFIISKLGSVVGEDEYTPGVYFHGDEHRELLEIQQQVARHAAYVVVLTQESEALWRRQYGTDVRLLRVPTGVDRVLPLPAANPYANMESKVAVYIGNIYSDTQQDINHLWQRRLNALGRALSGHGLRLCLIGPGNTSDLDHSVVTYMGALDQNEVWDHFYYADAGVALAQGPVQHNESSKLYYYLRTGLPVVSEAPIPNNWLITESGLGYIAPYADTEALAERVHAASTRRWHFHSAIEYMKQHHTWDCRASVYQKAIEAHFNRGPTVHGRGGRVLPT